MKKKIFDYIINTLKLISGLYTIQYLSDVKHQKNERS